MLIGVISDTHGLLRPEVAAAFKGADLILHAGDIEAPGILDDLRSIAPVIAVRGNVDDEEWARSIDETAVTRAGELTIYMLHDLGALTLNPATAGIHVVVSGHSHRPLIERRDGVLYINPGSAGPRRFTLPISVARLTVDGDVAKAELVDLG